MLELLKTFLSFHRTIINLIWTRDSKQETRDPIGNHYERGEFNLNIFLLIKN